MDELDFSLGLRAIQMLRGDQDAAKPEGEDEREVS